MVEKANQAVQEIVSTDPWAASTTQAFALIGVLWLSSKIFSFWRLIASLFVLPGTSVSIRHSPEGRQ